MDRDLPVAVIGAGPIGLATAAHLREQGLPSVVLEQGSEPAAGVAEWGHVQLFSPWRLNIDATAADLLAEYDGWAPPDGDVYPSGDELRERYLVPLAEALASAGVRMALDTRVVAVTRHRLDKAQEDRDEAPFELKLERDGQHEQMLARAVVDAGGSWGTPNPLGISGVPVVGERELADRIRYGIPDVLAAERKRFAGRRTLVVGAGHSAMNVVSDLARLASAAPGTRFSWAIRRQAGAVLGGDRSTDALPQRRALLRQTRELVKSRQAELLPEFEISAVERSGNALRVVHSRGALEVDELVAVTGVRPDLSVLSELRLDLDPVLDAPVRLAPLIDPRKHSCATVPAHGEAELRHPEPDFYLAGMKSYGRAPTFLMVNGYQQARSIAAALAGRPEVTPEVAVAGSGANGASCCTDHVAVPAGPATRAVGSGAGPAADEVAAGGSGSGCGPSCC